VLSKKAVSLKTIFLEKRIQSFSTFFSYGHLPISLYSVE